MPPPVVGSLPFEALCKTFDKVSAAKRSKKRELLDALCKHFGHGQSATSPSQSLWPLLRLALPELDTDRSTYGLRESALADVYIAVLGLAAKSESAQRLKNPKLPRSTPAATGAVVSYDFSSVLYEVIKDHARPESKRGTLTIADINAELDAIATAEKDAKIRMFTRLTPMLSAREHQWLSRIVIKDLKMGVGHESVLKMLHGKALPVYNLYSSLKTVCEVIADPARLTEFAGITVGRPVKPMLASSPAEWTMVAEWFAGLPYIIEDKYDGERLMIHKRGDTVQLFTRNSFDVTDRYAYGVALKDVVLRALPSVHSAIIDGELMSWDHKLEQYRAFGSNRTTAINNFVLDDGNHQLCFLAFDVLLIDEESLLERTLEERKRRLAAIVSEQKHQFELVQATMGRNGLPFISECLDSALNRSREGIILKQLQSAYLLNDRSHKWAKLKPDMVKGLHDSIDCVILGGYYGEGTRRSGDISHFLLGVADPTHRPPQQFYAFCKVGSGYTLEQLGDIRERLKDKWQPYDPRRQPAHFMGWRHERSDQPDLWVAPSDSLIIQVKCYEITECRTNKFHAGFTTRFPRMEAIRWDKNWDECATIDEIRGMAASDRVRRTLGQLEANSVKTNAGDMSLSLSLSAAPADGSTTPTQSSSHDWSLAMVDNKADEWQLNGHKGSGGGSGSGGKHRRGGVKRESPSKRVRVKTDAVSALFQPADVSRVVRKSDTLQGLSLCVISTDRRPSKQALERMIAEHGGKFTQHEVDDTSYVIASRDNSLRLDLFKRRAKWTILHHLWLTDSVESRTVLPIAPRYLIQATAETQAKIKREIDQFGDSFTNSLTHTELRAILSEMRGTDADAVMDAADVRVAKELHRVNGIVTSTSIFGGRTAAVRAPRPLSPALAVASLALRLHGGLVVSDADRDLPDFVLVAETETHGARAESAQSARMVDWRWVQSTLYSRV